MHLNVRNPRRDSKLQRLADLCAASGPADQADRVREALKLTAQSVSHELVEVMIAAQAFESAALAVIGPQAAWMVSKGSENGCLASILLPGMTEEVTRKGATPALALIGAWASAALVKPVAASSDQTVPLRPEGSSLH
jgi:hypothetical protein